MGSCHKEEVAALHKSITTLDQEKDALQDDVDLKTERLVELEEELARKVAFMHTHTESDTHLSSFRRLGNIEH